MERLCVVFGLFSIPFHLCLVTQSLYGCSILREGLRIGKLFEDCLAFLLVTGKKCRKLCLRELGHSSELLKGQSDSILDGLGNTVASPITTSDPYLPFWITVLERTLSRGLVRFA